jgi:peroxiredoxin
MKGDIMNFTNKLVFFILLSSIFFLGGSLMAQQQISENPLDISPLILGAKVPEVEVKTFAGKPFNLAKELESQLSVIIFFRGGWCPICMSHLSELRQVLPELKSNGFRILAISPDQPEVMQKQLADNSNDYELLSDSDMALAKAFGIAFKVDKKTQDLYKTYNIDLEAASGKDHHDNLTIRYSYVNPDYKVRISAPLISEAAKFVLNNLKKQKE